MQQLVLAVSALPADVLQALGLPPSPPTFNLFLNVSVNGVAVLSSSADSLPLPPTGTGQALDIGSLHALLTPGVLVTVSFMVSCDVSCRGRGGAGQRSCVCRIWAGRAGTYVSGLLRVQDMHAVAALRP